MLTYVHSHHGDSACGAGRPRPEAGLAGHPHRIDGVDTTGSAWAVVDPLGRFVDIGLRAGWWEALGPGEVAAALVEALACARLHAALEFRAVRGGDGEAIVVQQPSGEILSGPRGLIRLHVTGNRVDGAELVGTVREADGDELAADARDALVALGRRRSAVLNSWLQAG